MAVYLDWNATTPLHAQARAAMLRAEEDAWANPSSVHQAGRRARRVQEDAREQLASLLRRHPRDVIFTSGGTEANHLALAGATRIVTSRLEHPSVVAQVEWMAERGARVIFAEVQSDGRISTASVEAALRELGLRPQDEPVLDRSGGGFDNGNTALVAVMAANHETGVIQPLPEVHALTQRYGARLHVDAVQWLGRAPLEWLVHADSLAVAAHKVRGPKGLGALVFECGFTPQPLGRGGAQERGLRPGTVDAVALAGFQAALARLEESQKNYERVAALALELRQHVARAARCAVVFHGAEVAHLGHVVNLRFDGWQGDELVAALDLQGVCISSGSACSAGTAEPAPVITAMLGRTAAEGAVRISLGEETVRADVKQLVRALERLHLLDKLPF